MNKLVKTVAGVVFSGALVFSGCSEVTVGGRDIVDRSNSQYGEVLEREADETKVTFGNAFYLVDFYGSIGELEKMDRVVGEMTEMDFKEGVDCADLANKYNRFWKRK